MSFVEFQIGNTVSMRYRNLPILAICVFHDVTIEAKNVKSLTLFKAHQSYYLPIVWTILLKTYVFLEQVFGDWKIQMILKIANWGEHVTGGKKMVKCILGYILGNLVILHSLLWKRQNTQNPCPFWSNSSAEKRAFTAE